MKGKFFIFLLVTLCTILFFSTSKSFAQSNSIIYVHWGGTTWRADVVKSFVPDEPNPQIRFRHSQLLPGGGIGNTHYEDFLDYQSDAGEHWRVTVQYITATNSFHFTHCRDGKPNACHGDVIMRIRDNGLRKWELSLVNCSLEDFRSPDKIIQVNTRFLEAGPTPPPPATSTGLVYISSKSGLENACGCGTPGTGSKHYLYNSTASAYKVVIEITTYTSPNRVRTVEYTILPGQERYLGCSQSADCSKTTYSVKSQVKI